MHPHHEEAIQKATAGFQKQPEVEALLLGGSIAHGFETANSDIDLMILVSDREYEKRREEGRLHYYSTEGFAYEGGYADGKYVCRNFLRAVAEKGSEPARFAFQDARILFSRGDPLEGILSEITTYPAEGKRNRMRRFYAQFEAWNWYAHEALRLANRYLLGISIGKLVLFGGRLILAHNELLYPYHKWFMRILASAEQKPASLLKDIEELLDAPDAGRVLAFYERIKGFFPWAAGETGWPNQFMLDSELAWQNGMTAIDDL